MYLSKNYLPCWILLLCFPIPTPAWYLDAGVGFNLELDYGTASVHFANGSAHDVVKIEGGASYKDIMRNLSTTNDRSPRPPPSPFKPPKYVLPQDLQNAIDYVSSLWPEKPPSPPTPEAECLLWMLKALKTATEAYLEAPIGHVIVAKPVPLESSDIYTNILNSAASTLGLRLGLPSFLSANAAATAYDIKASCEDIYHDSFDNRLFIAINHNRAAFSVFLLEEECEHYDEVRSYHNKTLGSGSDLSREERFEAMKHALEATIRMPFPKKWGSSETIQDVVSFGESTDDEVLRAVLEEVFGSQLETLEAEVHQMGMGAIDPVFAGSRGAAKECTFWDVDWDGPHGCPI